MIFSAQELFSDSQQVTADADSDNVIDLGAPGTPVGAAAALNQDIGKGNPVEFVAQVDKVTDNGAAALTVNVITGSAVSGGAISSPVTLASTDIANADLAVGAKANIRFLPVGVQRYLGLSYGANGDAAVDVNVTAGINLGTQDNV